MLIDSEERVFDIARLDSGEPHWARWLFLLLVLVGTVLLVVWWRYSDGNGHLKAVVEYRQGTFYITNQGTSPWTQVEVRLNQGDTHTYYPHGEPKAVEVLPPGQSVRFPLSQFATRDGKRFYLTERVHNLYVKANVGGQQKSLLKLFF